MGQYVQLLTLNESGREWLLEDPHHLLAAQQGIRVPGVNVLGLYAVLGDYDFVGIIAAPDNEAAARFSVELGVKAGAHIMTLPAVPMIVLEQAMRDDRSDDDASVELEPETRSGGEPVH